MSRKVEQIEKSIAERRLRSEPELDVCDSKGPSKILDENKKKTGMRRDNAKAGKCRRKGSEDKKKGQQDTIISRHIEASQVQGMETSRVGYDRMMTKRKCLNTGSTVSKRRLHKLDNLASELKRIEKKKSSPYNMGIYESESSGLKVEIGFKKDKGSGPHYRLVYLTKTDDVPRYTSLGFLLFEEQDALNALAFKGVRVNERFRNKGLAKLFFSIWLIFTYSQGFRARANRIDKPVLSLLLQKFHFVPDSKGSRRFELSLDARDDGVNLYTENIEMFKGTFSKKECRGQDIRILSERPSKSVPIYVKTGFTCAEPELALKLATNLSLGLKAHWKTKAIGYTTVPVVVSK
eukprot:CAMPEP_0184477964 /NCGR_PEP_ID=MMETSP0113_2-20130426/99_1 /TAXON_ID=91329 /ORGANISM="Norrisiella sphaerica, Strain BC52" /LENGTH=348 /DNA_ID=CAMNT_0026855587 /DNA_START=43 /DNA_END=1089 /DNA_ORIENTATION=+